MLLAIACLCKSPTCLFVPTVFAYINALAMSVASKSIFLKMSIPACLILGATPNIPLVGVYPPPLNLRIPPFLFKLVVDSLFLALFLALLLDLGLAILDLGLTILGLGSVILGSVILGLTISGLGSTISGLGSGSFLTFFHLFQD